MEDIKIIENDGSWRWRMLPVPFLEINDVILTSPLLLNIIYVLVNFFDFIRDLTSCIYHFKKMDSTNRFNSITL